MNKKKKYFSYFLNFLFQSVVNYFHYHIYSFSLLFFDIFIKCRSKCTVYVHILKYGEFENGKGNGMSMSVNVVAH